MNVGFKRMTSLEESMLGWTLTFLIMAGLAALFGFGVIASTFASIAKILFYVFLVLFVLSLIFGRRVTV